MQKFFSLLFLILFHYCLATDAYYTYEKIENTLLEWQDTFGTEVHPSTLYSGFGIIYNLQTIGYSSQDSLPIYAVKLSDNVEKGESEPKVLILGQCHAEEIYGVEISMAIIECFLNPEQCYNNYT